MGKNSGIAWCDPLYGCTPASPGCAHCYAARQAARLGKLTEGTHQGGKWTGKLNLFAERMEQALRWKQPSRIFVASMSDLFHEAVPAEFLDEVFSVMALAGWHTFILLTKRPYRMLEYIGGVSSEPIDSPRDRTVFDPWRAVHGGEYGQRIWPLPNVVLMTTIEDQSRADERMPAMATLDHLGWRTGVSIEPMLGPVDLGKWIGKNDGMGRCDVCGQPYAEAHPNGCHARCANLACPRGNDGEWYASASFRPALSWVICGGESGPNARPMHPAWAISLRDQCAAAGVPFLFKQHGEWAPHDPEAGIYPSSSNGYLWGTICMDGTFYPQTTPWNSERGQSEYAMVRVGKHAAGRFLDGKEYNEFPG